MQGERPKFTHAPRRTDSRIGVDLPLGLTSQCLHFERPGARARKRRKDPRSPRQPDSQKLRHEGLEPVQLGFVDVQPLELRKVA